MQVVPYLEGEYTVEDFREDLAAKVGGRVVVGLRLRLKWPGFPSFHFNPMKTCI
jgi:hypothetical protein